MTGKEMLARMVDNAINRDCLSIVGVLPAFLRVVADKKAQFAPVVPNLGRCVTAQHTEERRELLKVWIAIYRKDLVEEKEKRFVGRRGVT
jgi:hypothetical protein